MPGVRGTRKNDLLVDSLKAWFTDYESTGVTPVCVTFTCGATGWRGTGGTIARTLVHEAAFQLDTGGNARGAYSVDLQQDRNNATEVAASAYSFIMGQDNRIDAGADHSYALGWSNEIGANAYACWSAGIGNEIDIAAGFGGQYLVYVFGESHNIDEANYVFFYGSDIDVLDEAFGVYAFGEQNDFEEDAGDSPTYTGMYAAIGCLQKGDVWSSLQVGENNIMETTTMRTLQVGYQHYSAEIIGALQVGNETCAYDPDSAGYYDGSFLIGIGVNDGFAADPWQGMNQGRILSQAGWVAVWNVAWATEWEFPIRPDMAHYFKAIITGADSGCANTYTWILEGHIDNAGGVTTLQAFTATVNYYRGVATKEWQVLADNVNDRLIFQFRDTAGPDATPCNLQLLLTMVEVGND